MIINIKSVGNYNRERLTSLAESLDVPAIITDENTKIIIKNSRCTRVIPSLRKGSKLSPFLEDGIEEAVFGMLPQEILAAKFKTGDGFSLGVLIICGFDSRLFIFNPLASDMLSRTEEIYRKASGFDNQEIKFSAESDSEIASIPNSREISKLLSGMLNSFKKARSLPFFDAQNVVNLIADTLSKAPKAAKEFEFATDFEKTLTQGNSHDLALILSFALAFCFENSLETPVSLKIEHNEDEAIFKISARTNLSVYDIAKITAIHTFDEGENDKNFWFYMVRLLADANLWSFTSDSTIDGTILFTLKTPLIRSVEDCLLRDFSDEDIISAIKIFFNI